MNPLSLQVKAILLGIVAVVFAGLLFAVHHYHNAYEVEHANFEGFKTQTKALGDLAEKHRVEIETKDAKLKELQDEKLQKEVAGIAAGWAADRAERDRLRKQLADTRLRPVPGVAVGPGLAKDKASGDAISAAVSKYVSAARAAFDDCRAAADEFRESVARQLEQAESNTAALINGVDWAAGIGAPGSTGSGIQPAKGFLQRIFDR